MPTGQIRNLIIKHHTDKVILQMKLNKTFMAGNSITIKFRVLITKILQILESIRKIDEVIGCENKDKSKDSVFDYVLMERNEQESILTCTLILFYIRYSTVHIVSCIKHRENTSSLFQICLNKSRRDRCSDNTRLVWNKSRNGETLFR